MTKKINRRHFLKSGAVISTAALLGVPGKKDFLYAGNQAKSVDIVVAKSPNRFQNTQKGVTDRQGMMINICF